MEALYVPDDDRQAEADDHGQANHYTAEVNDVIDFIRKHRPDYIDYIDYHCNDGRFDISFVGGDFPIFIVDRDAEYATHYIPF